MKAAALLYVAMTILAFSEIAWLLNDRKHQAVELTTLRADVEYLRGPDPSDWDIIAEMDKTLTVEPSGKGLTMYIQSYYFSNPDVSQDDRPAVVTER